jgi:hypothetical protein
MKIQSAAAKDKMYRPVRFDCLFVKTPEEPGRLPGSIGDPVQFGARQFENRIDCCCLESRKGTAVAEVLLMQCNKHSLLGGFVDSFFDGCRR